MFGGRPAGRAIDSRAAPGTAARGRLYIRRSHLRGKGTARPRRDMPGRPRGYVDASTLAPRRNWGQARVGRRVGPQGVTESGENDTGDTGARGRRTASTRAGCHTGSRPVSGGVGNVSRLCIRCWPLGEWRVDTGGGTWRGARGVPGTCEGPSSYRVMAQDLVLPRLSLAGRPHLPLQRGVSWVSPGLSPFPPPPKNPQSLL